MNALTADYQDKQEGGEVEGDSYETLCWLKSQFESAEEVTADNRANQERCRDYYDGKQLTEKEEKALRRRGQPPVIINRIKRKVNYVIGLEIKKRSDPKAYPRTPQHTQDADSATEALRYAADRVNFKKAKTAVAKEMFIEGGPTGCYIGVEKVKDRVEVTVMQIPWDRIFCDPHSREPDYSDAMFKGFITWMDEDQAEKKFPGKEEIINSTVNAAVADSKTYDDRPRARKWVDVKRKRVRIVEIYYDNGSGWTCATFTEGGFLKEPALVEYIDQDGIPECPLNLISANVDRDNNRYGEVSELIDLQDEINKRRSKSLHLLTMRQARFSRGVKDADKQAKELAKPDGKIIADQGEFEVLQTGDMARGQMELLAQATAEMEGAGANASLQGKGPEGASGRAILANQQGGQIELEPLMDQLGFWELECYRQIWNRIRQYWTGPMWIRVTDDQRNLKWVGLNKPMTNAEYAERQGMDPEQFAQSGMDPNAPAMDPQTGQPMLMNNIAELEVDIILDRGPDTVTLEQEQFDTLSRVPGIPPDMLIEVSSLRNKDKILERIRGETGPDGKPPPPPPEVVKAKMEAEEKQKDRDLQVALRVGDRELEVKKIEAQAEKDKRADEITHRKISLEEQRHDHEKNMLEHTKMQAGRAMVAGKGQPRSKPSGQGQADGQSDLFSTAISIQMPPDVAQILLSQSEAVTQSQIQAANAEEMASNAEAQAQETLPQLLQAVVKQSEQNTQAILTLTQVLAAPKKLVKTASGDKIAMPMLDVMSETVN